MTRSDPSFRFRLDVPVRFRDVDAAGHVHHSVALHYFEEARAAYWTRVVGREGLGGIDYVLAEANVRWRQRITWPQTVEVGLRVSRVGGRHFVMEYEVCSVEGARLVSGRTVQVMYDYAAGASTSVPQEVRAAIEAFEAGA